MEKEEKSSTRVTFHVLEGVDKGRVYRDLNIPVSIGREEGNSLRLNDERVSRFHAKVQHEDGDVIITDLESTNGTRVNGMPVQIRRLRPGDQVGIGRSTLLFGTLEEIANRKVAKDSPVDVPEGKTISGSVSKEDMDFDLNIRGTSPGSDIEGFAWASTEEEMPPLPQKLAASQAARLAEIFDFLHKGLSLAADNIEANDEGTEVTLGFSEWQMIQAVQMFLARYMRAVADPNQQFE
ncbi:FHA domain-containing protein [Telmatocola sphagniphila]|uniref:FHA domain-containing protein n=2 Tax=Telmatocola sphagniphila TaxID=1123043 RepID=A0A8E6BBQ7_9BACT|nr:FHA domain-containing protein [Telmatocola sphagniphila]